MRAVILVMATGVSAGSAACATYRAGSFESAGEPFLGERATAGCLDLAVDVKRDAVATGPVVQYAFGNRCDRAATVDLASVRVTGRTASGEEVQMVAYDPYGQIRALPIDARSYGRERIEYRTAREFGGDVIAVCVGIGSIAPSEPALQVATTCADVPSRLMTVAEAADDDEVTP
jgi:hypothetical protein